MSQYDVGTVWGFLNPRTCCVFTLGSILEATGSNPEVILLPITDYLHGMGCWLLSETQLQSFEIQLKTVGSVIFASLKQISSASSWNWQFHWEFSEITNINCWCSFNRQIAFKMHFATCFVDKCEQYPYLSVQCMLFGILISTNLVKRFLFWRKHTAYASISLL